MGVIQYALIIREISLLNITVILHVNECSSCGSEDYKKMLVMCHSVLYIIQDFFCKLHNIGQVVAFWYVAIMCMFVHK